MERTERVGSSIADRDSSEQVLEQQTTSYTRLEIIGRAFYEVCVALIWLIVVLVVVAVVSPIVLLAAICWGAYWIVRCHKLIASSIVIPILVVWVWPGLTFSSDAAMASAPFYLLSATAQCVATIGALVFALGLAAAQVSSRYHSRLTSEQLDFVASAYLFLVCAGILVPLVVLFHPTSFSVRLALTVSGLAITLLVPFVVRARQRLSLDWRIRRLATMVKSDMVQMAGLIDRLTLDDPSDRQFIRYSERLDALGYFATTAAAMRDYEVVRTCCSSYYEICAAVVPVGEAGGVVYGSDVISRVSSLARSFGHDMEVATRTVDTLVRVGIMHPKVSREVIEELVGVGLEFVAEDEHASVLATMGLLQLAQSQKSRGQVSADVVSALSLLGRQAACSSSPKTWIVAYSCLGMVARQAARSRDSTLLQISLYTFSQGAATLSAKHHSGSELTLDPSSLTLLYADSIGIRTDEWHSHRWSDEPKVIDPSRERLVSGKRAAAGIARLVKERLSFPDALDIGFAGSPIDYLKVQIESIRRIARENGDAAAEALVEATDGTLVPTPEPAVFTSLAIRMRRLFPVERTRNRTFGT